MTVKLQYLAQGLEPPDPAIAYRFCAVKEFLYDYYVPEEEVATIPLTQVIKGIQYCGGFYAEPNKKFIPYSAIISVERMTQ